MHNSITITWENGQSNGRPIEEFDIQIAEINVFDIHDVVYAQGAYHFDVGDEIVTLPTHNTNTTTRDDSAHRKKTVGVIDANNDDNNNDVVAWKNVLQLNTSEGKEINHDHHHHHHHHHHDNHDDSHDDSHGKCVRKQFKGRFIGGTTFKVLGLLPGSTYIFRLKHRNDCGWSSYR